MYIIDKKYNRDLANHKGAHNIAKTLNDCFNAIISSSSSKFSSTYIENTAMIPTTLKYNSKPDIIVTVLLKVKLSTQQLSSNIKYNTSINEHVVIIMKLNLDMLNDFLLHHSNAKDIGRELTSIGLEVEEIIDKTADLLPFIVAEIQSTTPHPNADRLKVCQVFNGNHTLEIVCGAPNARPGIKVVLATVGTVMPEGFKIKKSSIRGVESNGMLCSAKELGIGKAHEGILELDDDAILGQPFYKGAPVFNICITPNRGDCLSALGIARDLSATGIGTLINQDCYDPNYINDTIPNKHSASKPKIDIRISDDKLSQKFIICEIENVKNCPSPAWLKERIESLGFTSRGALIDISNYVMLEYGNPIHIYNRDHIIDYLEVTEITEDQTFIDLKSEQHTLVAGDIVIKDAQKIQCLAGIIGGEYSCCTDDTTNIIIEIAHFNKESIAKTGQRLKINTDSRYRFERGIDLQRMNISMRRTIALILEICGGQYSDIQIKENIDTKLHDVLFTPSNIKTVIGTDISTSICKQILTDLGFTGDFTDVPWKITPPSWRHDIWIEADIIEEIIRIYGYDHIPEQSMDSWKRDDIKNSIQFLLKEKIRDTLINRGMTDCITWSFMHDKKSIMFGNINETLRLMNPITTELNIMRNSIIPNLLDGCKTNIDRSISNINLFEIGTIYHDIKNFSCVATGVRMGNNNEENVHIESRNVNIFDVKQDCMYTLINLGLDITKIIVNDNNIPSYYHPSRSGSIMLGNKILGYFGEIHPKITKEFGIKNRVCCFELFCDQIPFKQKISPYKKSPSHYQPVTRDFAFVFHKDIAMGDVLAKIRTLDRNIIQSVKLVDLYTGEKVRKDMKSCAIRIILQSNTDTLTEEVLTTFSNKVISCVKKFFAGTLRDF